MEKHTSKSSSLNFGQDRNGACAPYREIHRRTDALRRQFPRDVGGGSAFQKTLVYIPNDFSFGRLDFDNAEVIAIIADTSNFRANANLLVMILSCTYQTSFRRWPLTVFDSVTPSQAAKQ